MEWGRLVIIGLLTSLRGPSALQPDPAHLNGPQGSADRACVTTPLSLVSSNRHPEPSPAAFARATIPAGGGCGWRATSLFSGGGGLDLGFLNEGVLSQIAFDKSAQAVASYNSNLPATARTLDLSRSTPPVDTPILLAGSPCQGFSTAGRREVDDPRNDLLSRVAELAVSGRPKVVLAENVPGALSGDHGRHWRALEDRLRLAGYNVRTVNLRGEDSGVAQRRRRLFLIAWIGSDCLHIAPDPASAPGLRACLAGVGQLDDHEPQWPEHASADAIIAKRIGAGQKLCNVRVSDRAVPTWSVPAVFGETCETEREVLQAVSRLRRRNRRRSFGDGDPVPLDTLRQEIGRDPACDVERLVDGRYLRLIDGLVELQHTYNGKYRRLDWNDLSPTVDTHFGRASLFLHPEEDRGLSHREAARIQGFPDAYRLPPVRGGKYELVGNAVPPPMAARVARFVREAILKA